MMATTHAYIGLAAAILTLPVTGGHASVTHILAAAFVGGLAPDVDLVTDHRKTLHYPVYLPVLSVALSVGFVVSGYPALLVAAVAVASAGLHSLTDILASGVGYEPWNGDSGRAVYNHFLGVWHRPRRLVGYSGSPADLCLASAFAVPCVAASAIGPTADAYLVGVLGLSAVYALGRRRLSDVSRVLRSVLPAAVVRRAPSVRFEED